MSEIYQPSEDSYFLSEILKKIIKKNKIKLQKFLDMGSGSGIQTRTAIKAGINSENITLVDINKEAVKYLTKRFSNLKVIYSNLFEKVKGKYDLIVFNPPYLPRNKKEPKASQLATTGGKKGAEIINKFLKQAKKHLNKNGKIILLTSSLTKGINWLDYNKKFLAKKKIFYEELYIWELS